MDTLGLIFLFLWLFTVILGFIYFMLRQSKQGKRKNFLRSDSEFTDMTQSIGFSEEDTERLRKMLARIGVSKHYLIFSDPALLEKAVKREVEIIEKMKIPPKERDEKILDIFEIKRKVLNHFQMMSEGLTSSFSIEANQLLSLSIPSLGKFFSIVILNDKKHLIISLPDVKNADQISWKDKSVDVYFWRYNDAGYRFKSKILGMVNTDQMKALILDHSPELKRIQRREYPRRKTRINARFFKFSIKQNEEGKPTIVLGNTLRGVIIDVSARGASFFSETLLKVNTPVKLEFKFDEDSPDTVTAYGRVIKTTKKNNIYILHIRFDRLSAHSKNLIYRYVYKYDED